MTELLRRRETLILGYVLNNLRHGPCNVVELLREGRDRFGYRGGEIMETGERVGVIPHKLHDELYWTRPANLYAIWWGNKPTRYVTRSMQQRDGGSAA